jgi:hypothetical protein
MNPPPKVIQAYWQALPIPKKRNTATMADPKELEMAKRAIDLFQRGKVQGIRTGEGSELQTFIADKDATLVCSPAPAGIVGSVQMTCAGCGRKVWVSPPAQASIKARGDSPTRIICLHCFNSEYKEELENA